MTRSHTLSLVARFGMVIALAVAGMMIAAPSNAAARPEPAQPRAAQGRVPSSIPGAAFEGAPPPAAPALAGDEQWSHQFMLGANNSVYALVMAVNGDLNVGGEFTAIAGVSANHVARWTASTNRWSALGSGTDSPVVALAIDGSNLYLGGAFTSAGGAAAHAIASWTISTGTWSDLGGGMAHAGPVAAVRALAIDSSGNVYAGGSFDSAGGVASQNIARWTGTQWMAAGGLGTTADAVEALAISGSDIYAGGSFTLPASHVAYSNNGATTWTGLGQGTSGPVYALAMAGSSVYVGGAFDTVTNSTPTAASNIALWNGSAWAALGAGLDGAAMAIALDAGGHVYVAGQFTHAGGTGFSARASHVAVWDGGNWSDLPWAILTLNGVNDLAYALAISGGDVYVGGSFTMAAGRPANYLARWNASDVQWYSPGNAVNGPVYAVAVSGDEVYLGGAFSSAGGLTANNVARWNASSNTWSTLGGGVAGSNYPASFGASVDALAIVGDSLYVGGDFQSVGGLGSANNIGRWDRVQQTWSTLAGGVTGCAPANCGPFVFTLVPDGGGVDAGGLFDMAGSATANNLARWTGSAWQTFTGFTDPTTGTDGPVYAIAPDGFGDYYIGGNFNSPRQNFVFFDFDTWNSAQTAPNGTVRAITLLGNDMYIGGDFTNAAGSGANNIAVSRNGGDWQPLGAGLNNLVFALGVRGQTLFAGGYFTQTGALGVNNIASWDTQGQTWTNVGSGADGAVYALATDPNFVYAGGQFANAGGQASAGVARWGQYHIDLPLVMQGSN